MGRCAQLIWRFFRLLAAIALLAGPWIGLRASAQEPIRGDFGVMLGGEFDQRMGLGAALLPGNVTAERFQPSYPLYLFRDYYAVVTPRTRLVAGIVARSVVFASMPECVSHLNAVQAFLARYGALRPSSQTDTEVLVQVDQGNRAAFLRCTRGSSIHMELNYVDYEMLRLREQEGGK
jgi:hypothetical protein